jgi:hypothetical protein
MCLCVLILPMLVWYSYVWLWHCSDSVSFHRYTVCLSLILETIIYTMCIKNLILTLFCLIFRRIYIINLVWQVTLRSSGTDILHGCHLLRRLYNILYFLWLYNEFFIILYNILKIAELDCCQIIILSIYVPSTHAYSHVLRLSLDFPYEKR